MARTALRSRRTESTDEEYDETPRSRRRKDEDDEEFDGQRPTRIRRRVSRDEDDEEEAPRARRRVRTDDDDDSPRPRRRSTAGYDSFEKAKATGGGKFPEWFKPEEEEEFVIKFLDAAPFAAVFQHWINKKPFGCIADENGEGCPLCDKGDIPTGQWYYNVVDLSDAKPALKVWRAGMRPTGLIKKINDKGKLAPVDRDDLYFVVTKPDRNSFSISAVRDRDLSEDWDVDPLTPAELEHFHDKKWDDGFIYEPSISDLRKAAKSLVLDGEDDEY